MAEATEAINEAEVPQAPSSMKVFLGGLSWETSEETLTTHFSKFGTVEDAVVMRDRMTKMPRGFGFITFKDEAAAAAACKESHTIDGKTIDAKPSVPQSDSGTRPKGKKLFVGGLSSETTSADFKTYFEKFGAIVDAQVMYDPNTKRSRGFGFVTYEDEDSVQKVLDVGNMHDLGGKQVEVKNATPKGAAGGERGSPMGYGGRGGRGGRAGGYGVGGGRGGFQQFAAPGGFGGGAYGYMGHMPYGYMGGMGGMPPYGAYPGMMMGYGQYGGFGGRGQGQPQPRGGGVFVGGSGGSYGSRAQGGPIAGGGGYGAVGAGGQAGGMAFAFGGAAPGGHQQHQGGGYGGGMQQR